MDEKEEERVQLIDRSARLDFCQLPENCRIYQNVVCKLTSIGEKTTIGNDSIVSNSKIGNSCEIERRNLIRDSKIGDLTYTGWDTCIMWASIGKFCSISRMVDIGGNEHNYNAITTMPDYKFKGLSTGKIVKHPEEDMISVGNDVWIGQGVAIIRKKGLSIGHGAVIGAGSVVTKSIPPYAVAAGVPAKVIKYRFSAGQIEKLLAIQWWDWPLEKIRDKWDAILSKNLSEETLRLLQ